MGRVCENNCCAHREECGSECPARRGQSKAFCGSVVAVVEGETRGTQSHCKQTCAGTMSEAATSGGDAGASSTSGGDAASSTASGVDFSVPHPLEHEWTLWYDQRMEQHRRVRGEKQQYENNLRAIGSMGTVESFWAYFNHVVPPSRMDCNANYHFFKKGIKPMWEDPANAKGGKWIIVLKSRHRERLDEMWANLLLALIGETLDVEDDICGAVCSRRKNGDKIAVWTKTKNNEELIMAIGRHSRAVLGLPPEIQLKYQVHEDSLKSASSYNNENKHVC